MSFFRRLFRSADSDPGRDGPGGAPDKDTPEQTPSRAEPAERPTPDASAAAWWESDSAPAEQPAAPAPAPQEAADPSETPTAPYSVLSEEEARARLAAEEQAEQEAGRAITPPHGTPVIGDDPMEGTRQLAADSAPAISSRRSAQGLAAMAARDIGRVRESNQDSVFAMLTTLPRGGTDVSIGLFIVADGMGGHEGGEVASRLAVRTVVYHVLSQLVMPALDESMTEALQPLMISAVQAANEAIYDSAQVMGTDMGTTCTAALLVGHGLYIAHVGDSRAYLLEPGGLRPLTADHSTVGRLIQLGQLDPSEAREHPLRNQLYRTVGQTPQVLVDFVYQPVGQSSHLLLCSDGLWGLVEEPLMEQALTRSPWPQDACEELIALANLAGGEDNISAVVVALPITER
jgi:serine/threonine protein phosphatase PrpC